MTKNRKKNEEGGEREIWGICRGAECTNLRWNGPRTE